MRKIHSLLFLFLIFTANSVFAVGLGVNPAYLHFDINSIEDLKKEIYVINNESGMFDFSLYSDSEAVKAFPERLSLNGGENRKVMVRLDPKKFKSDFEATLFILSSDPGKPDVRAGIKIPVSVNVRAGIKIPVSVNVSNPKILEKDETNALPEKPGGTPTGFFALAGQNTGMVLAGIIVIIAVAISMFLKKKKNNNQKG